MCSVEAAKRPSDKILAPRDICLKTLNSSPTSDRKRWEEMGRHGMGWTDHVCYEEAACMVGTVFVLSPGGSLDSFT